MILKNLDKSFFINLAIVSLVFLVDRISKVYVIYLDQLKNSNEIFSSKFLSINLYWNEGIAFGLFAFDKSYFYNTLTIIIFFIILFVFFMIIKTTGVKKYFLLFIFGGAIGNFYDRVFYKAVPDFIDFHIGEYHWFIFNFADVFISTGVFFMIFFEFFSNTNNNYV